MLPSRTNATEVSREKSRFGYWVILIFSFLYYFRPGDVIPGLNALHLPKIAAILAFFALILGSSKGRPKSFPFELKLILALFAWSVAGIPFAYWRGGSFNVVFFDFSKVAVVAVTLVLIVSRTSELRRLLFVQAVSVTLMTVASVIVNNRVDGRLAGIGDALLSNPNDLALNIALNWPLCLAFLLRGHGATKKIAWGIGMLVMVYAVMSTYSRGGFMAMTIAIIVSLWEFGVRGKRSYIIAAALLAGFALMVAVPQNYSKRLGSIVGNYQEGDKDQGSAEARKDLLSRSLKITAARPIFGIGAGNFDIFSGSWHGTHNTYTQLSAECGIPALLLFLVLLARSFRNLRLARRFLGAQERPELELYAGALRAAITAYLLGAFFASTAYQLFPYYLFTYTIILLKLSSDPIQQSMLLKTRTELRVAEPRYKSVQI